MKEMRLLHIILIGFLVLSSCSSDEDSNSDSIIGNWNVIESKFGGNDYNSHDLVRFSSDNRTVFTYERPDDDLILTGNWTRVGEEVTIIWDNHPSNLGPAIFEITELTNSTMKWKNGLLEETLKR